MKHHKIISILVALLIAVFLTTTGMAAGPDYASSYYWTVREDHPTKAFDVFYVHPTTYSDTKDGMNQLLDNQKVRAKTEANTHQQIGVYKDTCNVFAPRYRQMSIEVLSMKDAESEPYKKIATGDITKAFQYYLAHLNQGRPYIIAAHSQGSLMILRFLKEHRDLVKDAQFIAAYLPGWTFTDQDLKDIRLPFASSPDQTLCLLSWNTIAKGGKSPTLFSGAHCINPLTWTTTREEQPASLNLYALIDLGDGRTKKIPHFTSARIGEQGGLVIPVPAMIGELNMSMGPGVFHRYDYDFFYGNIKANVKERCAAWGAKHKTAK